MKCCMAEISIHNEGYLDETCLTYISYGRGEKEMS